MECVLSSSGSIASLRQARRAGVFLHGLVFVFGWGNKRTSSWRVFSLVNDKLVPMVFVG